MNKKIEHSSNTVNIRELETAIYQQNFPKAGFLIENVLDNLNNKVGIKKVGKTPDVNDNLIEYTRLASALTAFFVHPNLSLSLEGFQAFARHKKHLLTIFQLSGFRGSEHLLGLIGSQVKTNETKSQFVIQGQQQLMKFLLFYSLFSEIEMDYAAFLKAAPELATPVYFSLVGEECLLNPSACEKRDRLLKLGPLLEDIPIYDNWTLIRLSNLWMLCSYSESEHKHDIKKHLNKALQKWMIKQGVKVPSLPTHRSIKKRPVILIPSERFLVNHAMYRCYAPSIQQLREKFHLVLMANPKEIDDNSKTYFDQVIEVDFKTSEVKKLVGKVIKQKPDMIYYPSLGMSEWTLLLANLRFAPIQFMTLGHPATSHSPYIDYVLMRYAIYSDKVDCFSEKVVLMDTASIMHIAPSNVVIVPHQIRQNPSPVRLAITSTALKLNAYFMAVCQRISQQSQKQIEFHFFSTEKGMHYHKVKQRIHEWIPDANVYPKTDYSTYIANLNECDIHLSPFPFGGSNSNMDSMKQGIPIVALEGDEPHSRTDSIFFHLSNLPDWLLTHSQEDYVQAALRLIHNDEERVAISEALLSQDFERIFRDHEFRYHDKVFGKTVEWLYQYHEAIQKDGRKVWTVEAQNKLAMRIKSSAKVET